MKKNPALPDAAAKSRRPQWLAYLLAVIITVLTLAARLSLASWFGDSPALILFVLPIFVSAYGGGLGPGLVATVIVAVGTNYFLIPPRYTFAIGQSVDTLQWFILIVVGVLVSALLESRLKDRVKESEREKLAQLIEHSRDFIAMAELDGRLAFINSGGREMIGLPKEAGLGELHFSDYVPPNWQEFFRNTVIANAREHGLWEGEMQLRHIKTGALIDVFRSTFLIRDAAGEPSGFATVTRDITEAKRAKAALQLSEERLRAVTENLTEGLIISDPAGQLLHWNRAGLEMCGYQSLAEGMRKLPEFVDTFVHTTLNGEVLKLEQWPLSRVLRGETLRDVELLVRRRDMAWERVFSYSGAIIHDASDKPLAFLAINDITARQQAEAAVRANEQRLRNILDTMFVFVGLMNLDGEIVEVNHAPLVAAGLNREDVLGKTVAESYWFSHSPALQERVRQALARAAQGEIMRDDYLIRIAGGGHITIDTTFAPLRDAAGRVTQIVGSAVDITARKRTEGRFRRLVDSNAQGVIFWNTKGEIIGANDAFLQIVGYTRADLEAGRLGWAAMTPPEYADLDRRALEEMGAKGICTPFEKEYIRKDGSRVAILLGAAIFEDCPDEGVCFLLDITERKRTEQALRESEEHFRFLNDLSEATRTLADPAQIMAVMTRMLGQHLQASRCAYADVAPDSERFNIRHDYTDGCASTVGHYQLSLFGARAVATLNKGQTLIIRDVEAELLPGEGVEMFNAIAIKAIITCPLVKDGGLRAMMAVHQTTPRDWKPSEIAIVQDVVERCWATIERRTAEEKIHQLNTELEQRVIERTAQLEAANKELEAFSYSVSHDLRAPLRAVNGFAGIVLEDFGAHLPEEGKGYLERISKGGQRMGELIDDLLAFSRLSRQPLNKLTVDTNKLVRGVLAEELKSQLEGRQIEFQIEELPACRGDSALLKQVWVNLLSNAIKYTRDQKPARIEIGSKLENGGPSYFVRDNGVGFDMQYANKLFGVFQRLHRVDEFEGTGVGLAIVQRIVHRHGGRVAAEGKVNQGAVFHFTIEGETKI